MKHFSCIVLFLISVTSPRAQGFTGVDLYKICANPNADSVCVIYIRGFSEGYYLGILLGKMAGQSHQKVCYPQPPDQNPPDPIQTQLIVKKYMADHPEDLHKPALFIVQDALASAFSCRR